ncbi:MAG: 3'-5' exonuclease [Rhodobacteraceae bacterium]|nr:3'-5' exonuclease [Paracoccaceae bacterium]
MRLKEQAIQSSRRWIETNALILDTETTGLDRNAEIVEAAVIDCQGSVLLDQRIRPVNPIPRRATEVHGISDRDVADCPNWADIHDSFVQLVDGRKMIIYNKSYDLRLLRQSAAIFGLPEPVRGQNAECAMLTFAEFRHGYAGGRWFRLEAAARLMRVRKQGRGHSALGDCRTTLGVIRAMAES